MDTELLPDTIVASAYDAHSSALRRRLTGLTRDAELAEDLMQEAFVRLIVEMRAERTPDDIGAWLARVGHNLAMSQARRKAVAIRHRGDLVLTGSVASPEIVVLAAEEQRSVSTVLDGLSGTDRRALILAAHGYRGAEIARSIGRTEAATRTRMCRARARVREQILGAGAA